MFPENEAAKSARKGKGRMREDSPEPSIPSPEPTSRQRANMQHLLNAAAPMRPFSFNSFPPTTSQPIDLVMALHNQNLKNALYATVEKQAEELAARKIQKKELEIHTTIAEGVKLQEQINEYTRQIDKLLGRERTWRKTVDDLQDKLGEVDATFEYLWKEDTAESSHVNNVPVVEPVRLDCMVCKKFVSTNMMWPCRHVCVCETCNEATEFCPVCGMMKFSSVEVCIPTSE